jgi:uncharacterized protein YraI
MKTQKSLLAVALFSILFVWQAAAFNIEDRVQCTANLNVRSTPSTSGSLVTTESSGARGIVIGGPQSANGFIWYQITWDNGYSGWSVQDYLILVTVYNLNVASSNPNSGVYVYVGPNDILQHAHGTTSFLRYFDTGTSVTLIAPLTAGANNFQKWQRNGSDFSFSTTVNFAMSGNYTLTAVYAAPPPVTHTLTISSSNPNSGVSITGNQLDNNNNAGGTTTFTRTFNHNASVSFTAPITAGGNNFQKWQRDGVDLTTSTTATVTLDANHTITAVYASPPTVYTLDIASSNPNSGVYVYVGPNDTLGRAHGTTAFSRTFFSGTSITLIAPLTAGENNFQKWQRNGSDFSFSTTVDFSMSANYTLTAVYVAAPPVTHTLTISSSNPNSGVSITGNQLDNNNNAGGTTTFTRMFNHNATVTFNAPATAGGNNFQKWQKNGVDLTTSTTASVTMDADHTITAVFVAPSTAPVVQTSAATQQGTTTARLNGTVNPSGLNTTWYFQYGTTASYGQSTLSGAFGAGISTVQNVGYTIGGLSPNTLYHYRIVAFNNGGFVTGTGMTFQTLPLNQPDLIVENVTFSPSSVPAGNSFAINFRIRNRGTANCVATLARLRLSLDTNLTLADPPLSPLDVSIPAITAGNYYDYSGAITIPSTTPQGLYYVGIFADADNRAGQSDITNDRGLSASRVTVTGNGATLPVISAHPQNRNATQGDTVSFNVTVSGTGPFSYQWKRQGRPIYGETSSQLVLRNVSTLQAGNYAADVANAAGTVTSSNASLTVLPLTPIASQPIPGQCTIYGTIDANLPTVVITHGWQPEDWQSPALPSWVINMGQAISNRCVLAGLPANASGQRVNIIRYYWEEAFTPILLTAIDYTSDHGSRLAGQLRSPTILGESYNKKIHFIGHSLGTLVNTYAVHHLRNWNIEQFTILDAPLRAPSVDQWLFHRYLPSERVKWVDNYYGTSTAFPAAAGGPIDGTAPTRGLALNANHPGVHDDYHATIANAASTHGFFYSCLLPNFDTRPTPQWWNPPAAPLYQGVIGVLDDWVELLWYVGDTIGGGTMQIINYQIDSQLRGAIRLSKPSTAIASVSQAGGPIPTGAGDPEPSGSGGIAEVSAAIDLVIPADAQYLTFKFLCADAGQGDWLTAKFNDNLLMSFRADSFTGTNFQTATMSVSDYAGQAGQLVVKLNSGGIDASEFVMGDFSFLTTTAPVFSNPRVLSGAFQFDLRGLIGSNYVVQVSTNLINWGSMSTSTIPTEGSITITNPINGQPKQFYRAVTP